MFGMPDKSHFLKHLGKQGHLINTSSSFKHGLQMAKHKSQATLKLKTCKTNEDHENLARKQFNYWTDNWYPTINGVKKKSYHSVEYMNVMVVYIQNWWDCTGNGKMFWRHYRNIAVVTAFNWVCFTALSCVRTQKLPV